MQYDFGIKIQDVTIGFSNITRILDVGHGDAARCHNGANADEKYTVLMVYFN